MTFRMWERWGPLAGLLAIVCWIVTFSVGGNAPDTNDPDAKIAAFYTSHSHQVRDIVVFFIFLAGILFFLGFLAALRSRLVEAEGVPGRLTTLGFGSGVASAVLFLIAMALFTSPAFTANDTGKFRLDPNTYRLVNDLGYAVWVGAVIVAALLVWATSAIALRSGLLPKWFAWLGVLAGILQLLAIFFIPVFIFWGWILIVSLMLFFRSAAARTPAPPVAT
jgi:magnesium-transporting ATPase (P-type)